MSNDLKRIKNRIALISGLIYAILLVYFVRLVYVSVVLGPELRKQSAERLIERKIIPAKRGDIYSADGKTLATTKPVYKVHFDAVTVDEEVFQAEVAELGAKLATINNKYTAAGWTSYLKEQRIKRRRYVPLASKLNFSDLQRMRSYPILERGAFKGGIIIEEDHERIQMATNMQMRTIGYDLEGASAGLEGYYSEYLKGKPGSRLKQKIAGGDWKPLEDPEAVEPVDGFDLITTIDTRIQDVAQQSLLNQLKKYKADHGSVVVMEVETGKIVAMANLGRSEDSTYSELRNYAVWEATEPGSTMKLLTTMTLLETGAADTNTVVDTENGVYTIYGKNVRDSKRGGYGEINLRRAFEVSSNTGIVKLVYERFKDDPDEYVDFLYRRGVHEKTGVSIKGETTPNIPKPSDANWSGITLPWMAYGYSLSMTPLQLLTFYNAVANDGVMVQPQIVEQIMDHGRSVENFETKILNPAICSETTIAKLKVLLEGVVQRGTAKNLKDERIPLAGKTGTCQLNYWRGKTRDYQSSFAGYFPADDPKYSCIVVINKPDYHIGYYGNTVAGPVFKDIAEEVYSQIPQEAQVLETQQLAMAQSDGASLDKYRRAFKGNYLPSLNGLNARDAIRALNEAGLKVQISGAGSVYRQSPKVGTPLNSITTVKLELR